jgi:hypothetical protein
MKLRVDPVAARKDPAYFARTLLRYDIHAYQESILRDDHQTTVWVAGRGVGKTYTAVTLALWCGFTNQNFVVIYISNRQQQAQYAGDVGLEMLQGTLLADDVYEKSATRTRFRNGSTIYLVPGGNPTAARGWHNRLSRDDAAPPGLLVVIDEAATISRDTYVAAQGILNTAPPGKGKMLIVGSPLGTNHWFYTEYQAGLDESQKHTKSFHTPSTASPHVDPARLDEWAEKMSPIEYGAEIGAQFQAALDSYFGEFIEPAIDGYQLPLGHTEDLQYSIGIDLSSSERIGSSFTALVVGCRDWPKENIDAQNYSVRICEILRFQHISQESLAREIRLLTEKYPALWTGIVEAYESTQVEPICKVVHGAIECSRATDIPLTLEKLNPSNAAQREAFAHMHQLLRDGILSLPDSGPGAEELVSELKGFSYELTGAGNIRFGATSGGKDDVVYATAWMLWDLRTRRNRSSRLASYGDDAMAVGSMRDDLDMRGTP